MPKIETLLATAAAARCRLASLMVLTKLVIGPNLFESETEAVSTGRPPPLLMAGEKLQREFMEASAIVTNEVTSMMHSKRCCLGDNLMVFSISEYI